jgi:hypothetical protein
MTGDYEVGFGRPPRRTRWKKGQSGNRGRQKARRPATTAEIIDKLLLAPVDITENGKPRRVTTLEAILLQMWRKEMLGNRRAWLARLKYQELARQHAEIAIEIAFVDSPYTPRRGRTPQPETTDDGQV